MYTLRFERAKHVLNLHGNRLHGEGVDALGK